MTAKILSLLFITMVSQALMALNLPPIENPKDDPVAVAANPAPIACDQIVASLMKYNQMALQHETSLTSFLGDVGTKVSTWYSQLQPLEGTTQSIPAGTFSVLQDGGNKISQITDMAYNNSDLLATQMNDIITSLKACTLTPAK